jgi:hypothetical protein
MLDNIFNWFGENGKSIFNLIQNSVKILGRDKDIFKPLTAMFIAKAIRIILIFTTVYMFLIAELVMFGFLLIIGILFYLMLESYYHMRCKAISSWMVYDILRGIDTDVPMAKKALKGKGFTLFIYAVIDHVVNRMKSNANGESKNGVLSMIFSILMSMFAEVWDLVKNFTLPAIVIEGIGLKEVPAKLKLLRKNAPEALTGILGFDVAGGILGKAFGILFLPFIFLGIFAGVYGQKYLPGSWAVHSTDGSGSFNILIIFILLFISSIFTCMLNSIVHLVKSSYFTIFYVALTRPEVVHKDLREHISHYLDTDDRTEHYDFFSNLDDSKEESGNDEVEKMAHIILKNVQKGKLDKDVAKLLVKKGKAKEAVKKALLFYRKNLK